MAKRMPAAIASLLLLASCGTASAYFEAPTVSPPTPVAGQPVSMSIFGGECDALEDGPAETDISQTGQAIQIIIDGYHADDPILCFPIFGTWTYPIGAYPPGDYTLEVIHRYPYPGGPILQPLGTVPFTVTSAPPRPVPSGGLAAWALLVLTLLLGGGVRAHRVSRRCSLS